MNVRPVSTAELPTRSLNDAARAGRFHEFHTGWPLLLAATLGVSLGFPTLAVYSLGVLAPELARSFHWQYSEIMRGMALANLVLLFASPATGSLCDRMGVRRVAVVSAALLGLTFMGFALSSGSLSQYYATWLIMSVLAAGTAQVTWTRAVNQHFQAHRGLALGIALSGIGMFAVFGKLLSGHLIAALGWRGTYVVLGLLPILVVIPVGLWGLTPRTQPLAAPARATVPAECALTLAQALRRRHFWTLAVAFLPMGFALGGPIPNLENLLLSHGLTKAAVLSLTPWLGITMIAGRICGGWLADYVWVPLLACALLGFTAAGCILLAQPVITYSTALIAILLSGTAVGAEIDLASYMVACYLGIRHYGLLYGLLYSMIALAGGAAPTLFAAAFDRSGSYAQILVGSAVALIVPGALLLSLGPYPRSDPR